MTDQCPRCDSPAPHLHPAVQSEGEVQPCPHPFHGDGAAEAFAKLQGLSSEEVVAMMTAEGAAARFQRLAREVEEAAPFLPLAPPTAPLREQIVRLANVIIDEIPGEPSTDEGAIRLLRAAYVKPPDFEDEDSYPTEGPLFDYRDGVRRGL